MPPHAGKIPIPGREAVCFQIILGLSVVGTLFYFQSLASEYAKTILGAASVFGGGALSGGLHALSGPDHLAAILPFILGQKWYKAAYFGCVWGLGHGLTASVLGAFGYYVKDSLLGYKLLPQLANLADYAVGITLIIIGLMGLHESQQEEHSSEHSTEHSSEDNKNIEFPLQDTDREQNKIKVQSTQIKLDYGPEDSRDERDQKDQRMFLSNKEPSQRLSSSFAIPMTIFANGCFLGKKLLSLSRIFSHVVHGEF